MGPKKKKKTPQNDYYFFMQDMKDKLRREGRTWNNMEELAAISHPYWRALSEEEKAPYKAKAKAAKEAAKLDLSNKYDSTGRCLADIRNQAISREKYLSDMNVYIQNKIASIPIEQLLQNKFYFIHFNHLCELESVDGVQKYLPCEVSVAEWSLQGGISNFIHSFINPPSIPTGSMYEITKTAEDTHRITTHIEPMMESDAKSYSWICKLITSMLESNKNEEGKMPPLYTTENDEEKVSGLLESLFDWGMVKTGRPDRVYHIHQLFYQLSTILDEKYVLRNPLLAHDYIETDRYTYTSNIACPFHEAEDRGRYCSLMYVKRWSYALSDYFCDLLNVKLLYRSHRPPREEDSDYYEIYKNHFNGKWVPGPNYTGAEKPKGRKYIPTAGVTEKLPEMDIVTVQEPSSMFRCHNPEFNSWEPEDKEIVASSWTPTLSSDKPNFKTDDFPTLGGGRGRGIKTNNNWKKKTTWNRVDRNPGTSNDPEEFPGLEAAGRGISRLKLKK